MQTVPMRQPNCASRISTNPRKFRRRSSALRTRRCIERPSELRCGRKSARNRNTGIRRNTNIPCNIRPDNNRCRRLRTVLLHILPEMWQRDLRKGLTATLSYDAWILQWFSSDDPLSSILIPYVMTKPFLRLRAACSFRQKGRLFFSKPFLYDSCRARRLVAPVGALGLR